MMKLCPCLLLLAALCSPAYAEPWQAALRQKTKEALVLSTRAHKESVFEISLRVRTRFQDQSKTDVVSNHACTAVLIDPNYLLASQNCKGSYPGAHHGKNREKSRQIEAILINGQPAQAFYEDPVSQTILIQTDTRNTQTMQMLAGKPTAHLFIMTRPDITHFNQAAVNKKAILWGRESKKFYIKKITNKNGRFFLPKTANTADPAFLFSEKKPGMEFLAGFNLAEPEGDSPGEGFFYHPLEKEFISFLEQHVSKEGWQRLQKKIKDESFFK